MRGLALAVSMAIVGVGLATTTRAPAQTGTLQAFGSDRDLSAFLKKRASTTKHLVGYDVVPVPVMAAPPPLPPPPALPGDVTVTGSRPQMTVQDSPVAVTAVAAGTLPSITNTQEADVDEGGIVKVHGDHLVILRRGRLFTVAVGDRTARAVDRIDAFPPGTTGQGAWYDEMLVAGDQVIVVGYSYDRGGTEINRFRIGADGRLSYLDTHHLRSNDYYSSSNYASRLIGNRLIFYTPLDLDIGRPIAAQLPALRRWTGSPDRPFARIAPATRIYVPAPVRRDDSAEVGTLHTVTTCDLAAPQLSCTATGVLGSGSRNFYVSGNAVYVWIAGAFAGRNDDERALVYRLPLDGDRPGAAQAWGGPVDQFSFREDRPRRALDVLVHADGAGERMWRAQVSEGDAALLHLPLSQFGDGAAVASRATYRPLPLNRPPNYSFHNRFVGQHLIYSAGEFAGELGVKTVFAVPVAGGPIAQISVPHAVDRIDVMGSDAVVIGNDARRQLGFSAILLVAGAPHLGDTSLLPAAREGENRSQAFFFRPDPDSPDGASGALGLPVTKDLGETPVARFLGSGSAVAFLRRDARRLSQAGELEAHAGDARDDGCQASCVDWYGNARPIFLGDRVFALMGYELVEGRLTKGRIGEVARLSFAPQERRR